MSLKVTHSVIIILSILLTAYFSFEMSNSNIEYALVFSLLSAFFSISLIIYLVSIIKKFPNDSIIGEEFKNKNIFVIFSGLGS